MRGRTPAASRSSMTFPMRSATVGNNSLSLSSFRLRRSDSVMPISYRGRLASSVLAGVFLNSIPRNFIPETPLSADIERVVMIMFQRRDEGAPAQREPAVFERHHRHAIGRFFVGPRVGGHL